MRLGIALAIGIAITSAGCNDDNPSGSGHDPVVYRVTVSDKEVLAYLNDRGEEDCMGLSTFSSCQGLGPPRRRLEQRVIRFCKGESP